MIISFRHGHLPRKEGKRVELDRLLIPASCPPAPKVLRQLKANSGVGQASHSPCLNTRLSAAHLLSLAILNYQPQATLGAKSHSGQWAGSPVDITREF